MNHTAEKLLTFIKESPTAFQAVEMMKTRFTENGFTELKEDEHWEIKNGGKYFVIRNIRQSLHLPCRRFPATCSILLQATVIPRL